MLRNAARAVAISLPFVVPSLAMADQCSDVLVGIYDKQFVENTSSHYAVITHILTHYQASSYSQAKSVAADAGITLPIDGIPVPLRGGYKTDSNDQGNWADQLNTYFSTHTGDKQLFISQTETANADVVKAWKECMVSRTGVTLRPDFDETSSEVIISAHYLPPTTGSKEPTITTIDYDKTQLTMSTPENTIVGQKVPYPWTLDFRMKRPTSTSNGASYVILFYRNEDKTLSSVYIKIKALPVRQSVPLSITHTQIDFDGDRLPDSYVLW